VDFGDAKILDAIFLGQFLLLSTTVLNDNNLAELREEAFAQPYNHVPHFFMDFRTI